MSAAESHLEHRQVGGPFAEYDRIGRKQPMRMHVPFWLLFIAKLDPDRLRQVPTEAIVEEGYDEIGRFACVQCTCGKGHIARERLEQCAGCERWYSSVEPGAVFVTYGNMVPPPRRRVHYDDAAEPSEVAQVRSS